MRNVAKYINIRNKNNTKRKNEIAATVRKNVRNKWGHCNLTDWTEAFFNDCFSKLKTLVRSLGLTGAMEKTTLDHLSNWQTKGETYQ